MFTIAQISEAHSQIKSGSDFPKYIKNILALEVSNYETFVTDGHTVFEGSEGQTVISGSKYEALEISEAADVEKFRHYLREHQQGKSDYLHFCRQCANTGIEKWKVNTEKMTCTYFDTAGNKILVEDIPEV